MKTKITVLFDWEKWPLDSLCWTAGYDEGINIICNSDDEAKKALENVYSLGHNATVTYMED